MCAGMVSSNCLDHTNPPLSGLKGNSQHRLEPIPLIASGAVRCDDRLKHPRKARDGYTHTRTHTAQESGTQNHAWRPTRRTPVMDGWWDDGGLGREQACMCFRAQRKSHRPRRRGSAAVARCYGSSWVHTFDDPRWCDRACPACKRATHRSEPPAARSSGYGIRSTSRTPGAGPLEVWGIPRVSGECARRELDCGATPVAPDMGRLARTR